MSIGIVLADAHTFQPIVSQYYILPEEAAVRGMYSAALNLADAEITKHCNRREATREIVALLRQYGLPRIFAYNASFDKNHLYELASFTWCDIMWMSAYKQFNPSIPDDAEINRSGRLKRGAGVEPTMRRLRRDMSYHETHNALLDALDELEIMRRLGHSIEQYARPRSVSQPVTRKDPDTRLKTAVSVSPETDAPADYFLKGTLAQGVPEKTVAPRHELSSELKSFISTALSYDVSPLIEEAVPLMGYQEAHASLLAGEELLTKLKVLVSTSPTYDEARNALRDFYEDEVMRALREIPVESLSHRKSGIRVNALKDSGYTNMRQIYRLNYNGLLAINGIGPKNAENIFAEASHMAREVRTKIAAKPCFAKTPAGKKAVRDYCRYKWAIKIHTSIEGILAAEEKLLDDYCYVAAPASDILRWTFTLSRKKKEAALQAATALQKRITNTTRELVHTAEILYAHCSEISFEEAWTDYTKVPDEYNAWLTKNRTQDA